MNTGESFHVQYEAIYKRERERNTTEQVGINKCESFLELRIFRIELSAGNELLLCACIYLRQILFFSLAHSKY